MEILKVRIDIQQPGENFALLLVGLQGTDCLVAIVGIKPRLLRVEMDNGAIVEGDLVGKTRVVISGDFLTYRHKNSLARGRHIIPRNVVALGGLTATVE